jgi:osmotically-inducible protein OsmY
VLLAGGLAACDNSHKTAGQQIDAAVASTERKADELTTDMKQGAAEVKDAAKQAATATGKVFDNVAITAGVNAALAKDPDLSAMKIDVDTRDGQVTLNGTAPDAAAKSRATTLAAGVEGVGSVDNRLTVR